MASLASYTATCPQASCGDTFTTWGASTYTAMGMESDHRVDYGFEDPSPYFIHTCISCGFTAPLGGFVDVDLLRGERAGCGPVPPPEPALIDAFGTSIRWPVVDLVDSPYDATAVRWLWAAHCAPDTPQAQSYRGICSLRASQHARLAGNRALEVACQKQAAACLAGYLSEVGEHIDLKQHAELTYIVAELCRRLGRFEDALMLFDRVLAVRPAQEGAARMRRQTLAEDPTPRMIDGSPVVVLSPQERRHMWAQLQALDRLVIAGIRHG